MRPLKLDRLWIVPAIYLAVAALMFWQLPPTGVGGDRLRSPALRRCGGRLAARQDDRIERDPETHALNQKASPAAMSVPARVDRSSGALGRGLLGREACSPAMLTDPLIAFALGMFSLTRVELYLRAKRLLDEARGRA